MPLIDRAGPGEAGRRGMGMAGIGDGERVIADLGATLAMAASALIGTVLT